MEKGGTMIRQILVQATGEAGDKAVFGTALAVARLGGAHLQFLHVRPDVTDVIMAMASGGMGGGAAVQSVVDRLEEEAKQGEARARASVAAFCTEAGIPRDGTPGQGVSTDLVVEVGAEAGWIGEHGRFADLIVVGRARAGQPVALDVLEAALMETGRPVLLAGPAVPAALPGVVMIGWKDTPEAARAVAGAMPLIDRAERVVIATVAEGTTLAPTATRLRAALRWHNAKGAGRAVAAAGRDPADALVAEAVAAGAGLLVIGGYSHSRLREVVFGGVTQKMLAAAPLPILMAH